MAKSDRKSLSLGRYFSPNAPGLGPRIEARTWIWASMALVLLLALSLFYRFLLGPQVAFGGDRAELLGLRELWVQSAAGFGLRGEIRPREEFMAQYRAFRSRPTVRMLLREDLAFSTLAGRADLAFGRLEMAELRGEAGAALAAADFDAALGGMASRVASYAQERLEAFRVFYFVIVLGFLAMIVGFALFEQRLRATSRGEARNRALTRALIAAQEGERLRLSRELHDAVAQDLAAAKLYCELSSGQDAERAAGLLDRAIEEVRNICHGLRPAELDRLGITEAASRLCTEAGREGGFEADFASTGLIAHELDAETEITLYRILQEALSNVKRHSKARRVKVRIAATGDLVELLVEDDGEGPNGAQPGLGRAGMEERARMIGGSFKFGPGFRGGTSLRVTAPARRKGAS